MADTKTTRFFKDGLKISGTAALLGVVSEYALARTNLSHGVRGGVQAVAGAALAVATMETFPNVAAGSLAFAFVAGTRGAAQEFQLRRLLARTAAQPAALPAATAGTTTTTGTTTTGAAGAGIYGRSGGALGAPAQDNLFQTWMAERAAA